MEPGLKELLSLLSPLFGLAVATNRSNTIGKVLELNGLAGFFDIVVSALDVKRPKPNPEAIFKILGFFDRSPSQVVYVVWLQVWHWFSSFRFQGFKKCAALLSRYSGLTRLLEMMASAATSVFVVSATSASKIGL